MYLKLSPAAVPGCVGCHMTRCTAVSCAQRLQRLLLPVARWSGTFGQPDYGDYGGCNGETPSLRLATQQSANLPQQRSTEHGGNAALDALFDHKSNQTWL